MNLNYYFSGIDKQSYEYMGCHKLGNDVEFCLWSPHAFKVDVVIDDNTYSMHKIDERGIWHLFIDSKEYDFTYVYRIYTDEFNYLDRIDPYSFAIENNKTKTYHSKYVFSDEDYLNRRAFSYENKLNIYEVHLNGFKKDNEYSSYKQLKNDLIPYVKNMGYSHIEIMPIFEYPFDGSWGYQAYGFFSPTNRHGNPDELKDFINECHINDIGVILDVSYLQFAADENRLGNYDGKPCYEYQDEQRKYSSWGSYCFDLTSGPVNSFLISSAHYFINEFHFDGLKVDAVSNYIYFNGDKNSWENKDGIEFIKRFNYSIKESNPECILIAESSSDYEGITKAVHEGGLGFDYIWDLGWMSDTLQYYACEPEKRQYHHNQLTFSMAYFNNEKYLLPLSHDEVVHGKKTILEKIYGSYNERFAQCRNLFLYMFTHPGKKLNFLGNDIAMIREFDEKRQLDWNLFEYPMHDSFNRFFKDLCSIYNSYKALYAYDYESFNFKWIDADNYHQSVYIYTRYDEENCFVIVLNMKPVAYSGFRIGVPFTGEYFELINSEKDIYSGCNMINDKQLFASSTKAHGLSHSISIDLAPYAAIIFSKKIDRKAPVYEDPEQLFVFDSF